MRITAISDLHGWLPTPAFIPECDLLLIAGDVCPVRDHSTTRQTIWLRDEFAPWLKLLPAKEIVGVAGNHDFVAEKFPREMSKLPWNYLQDDAIEYDGLIVYGTPWVPNFGPWAFMTDEVTLGEIYDLIPPNTDILVSHGPAAGLVGLTSRGVDAGSESLRLRIERLTQLKLHVCGHIHEAFGVADGGPHGAIYANSSFVDLHYQPRPTQSILTFEL